MDLSGCQTQMSDTHFSQNKSSKSKQNFCFLIYFLQEEKKKRLVELFAEFPQ